MFDEKQCGRVIAGDACDAQVWCVGWEAQCGEWACGECVWRCGEAQCTREGAAARVGCTICEELVCGACGEHGATLA